MIRFKVLSGLIVIIPPKKLSANNSTHKQTQEAHNAALQLGRVLSIQPARNQITWEARDRAVNFKAFVGRQAAKILLTELFL